MSYIVEIVHNEWDTNLVLFVVLTDYYEQLMARVARNSQLRLQKVPEKYELTKTSFFYLQKTAS